MQDFINIVSAMLILGLAVVSLNKPFDNHH